MLYAKWLTEKKFRETLKREKKRKEINGRSENWKKRHEWEWVRMVMVVMLPPFHNKTSMTNLINRNERRYTIKIKKKRKKENRKLCKFAVWQNKWKIVRTFVVRCRCMRENSKQSFPFIHYFIMKFWISLSSFEMESYASWPCTGILVIWARLHRQSSPCVPLKVFRETFSVPFSHSRLEFYIHFIYEF